MEQNPAFLICWNYNDSCAGLPTHEKICETQGTAESKVPFMFMPGFDSISCYTVGSSALCANIARFFCAPQRMGYGYVRGLCPGKIAATSTPARLAFLRNVLSTAA